MTSGATIHAAVEAADLETVQKLIDEDEARLDALDEKQRTPIMIAALKGEATIGSILAECGAQMDHVDIDGNTALHHACAAKKRLVVSMLLWGGSERNIQNKDGNTALHLCAGCENYDCAWLLVENQGEESKKVKNADGKYPLDIAKEKGYAEIVELLEKDD